MTANPHPMDVHVGSRIRLRRTLLGMSQERFGAKLGLTFQQIQKYETGKNRVSASRLWMISRVLDVPVSFFFDDYAGGGEKGHAPPLVDASRKALSLHQAFARITDDTHRTALVGMARALAEAAPQKTDLAVEPEL